MRTSSWARWRERKGKDPEARARPTAAPGQRASAQPGRCFVGSAPPLRDPGWGGRHRCWCVRRASPGLCQATGLLSHSSLGTRVPAFLPEVTSRRSDGELPVPCVHEQDSFVLLCPHAPPSLGGIGVPYRTRGVCARPRPKRGAGGSQAAGPSPGVRATLLGLNAAPHPEPPVPGGAPLPAPRPGRQEKLSHGSRALEFPRGAAAPG